ncbi:MAG TPA: hypothetical protein VJB65_00990, partial [Patescibacteria group bacterium]|nr:hypothetical protein [Patescibacteria group bacterium]
MEIFYFTRNRVILQVMILCMVSIVGWVFVAQHAVAATWNQPTCNPDTDGPTAAACNVSAPLNVSSAAQIKAGALTIQNTVQAAQLELGKSLGTGNGMLSITNNGADAKAIQMHVSGTDGIKAVDLQLNGFYSTGMHITMKGEENTGIVLEAVNESGFDHDRTGMMISDFDTGIYMGSQTTTGIYVASGTTTGIEANGDLYAIKGASSNGYAGHFLNS